MIIKLQLKKLIYNQIINMKSIRLVINDESIQEIKTFYGRDDYDCIETVVNNLLYRYLGTGYFDDKLSIEDSNYLLCPHCGEKAKSFTMIDIDGKNLEEYLICKNCGSGTPELL